MSDAYAAIEPQDKAINIADEQGRAWWVKNFKAVSFARAGGGARAALALGWPWAYRVC